VGDVEIAIWSKGQASSCRQPTTLCGNEDILKGAGCPVVAEHLARRLPAYSAGGDVEMAVRSERHVKRCSQTTTASRHEPIQERTGRGIVPQDITALCTATADVEMAIWSKGKPKGRQEPPARSERIYKCPCTPVVAQHAVGQGTGNIYIAVRAEN